jgi:NAD(P)-dependent dehydrogenase (short-subunit alcohol dehydrogenase family)
MKEVKNKVAVVTGAASGIGRAMAETFLAAGMKVVLSDIDERALAETTKALGAAGAEAHAVLTDVSQPEQVDDLAKQTLQRFGAVHVLCNNAGIYLGGEPSWTSSLSDWRWMLGVNLMGAVHGIRSFLPIMLRQDSEAHIVNTASMGGLVATGSTLYGTAKSAVVGLSENLHVEMVRGGLKPRVSVLCPSLVATNILSTSRRTRPAEFEGEPQSAAAAESRDQHRNWAAEALQQGLDPRVVGAQVLEAIRTERLYILTHPKLNPFIKRRTKGMLKGYMG